MTVICAEHSALLRGISKNMKDETRRKVYSDWLQERDDPAWYVVSLYEPEEWCFWVEGNNGSYNQWRANSVNGPPVYEVWSVPWLIGTVRLDKWVQRADLRTRYVLEAYADGKVQPGP